MRIQKDIDNLERIKDKIATMPLTFEDAIEFHKRVIERVEKERKEANKELGIGDIEKDGFTGRTDNFKTSTPELKKMKLSESLFEEDTLKKNNLIGEGVVDTAAEEERSRQREIDDAQARRQKQKQEQEREKRIRDKVWNKKDWIAEKAKAEKEGRDIDLSGYSEEEQKIIRKGLDDFASDETAQAQYMRDKKEEAEKKREEEKKKAEEERKKQRKELTGFSDDVGENISKVINTISKVPGAARSGLRKAGINI